jgi:hypothetical protein
MIRFWELPTVHTLSEIKQVEIFTSENGVEVLWGDASDDVVQMLSVPVFAYGISRGTIVSTKPSGNRTRLVKVIHPSQGGTIRCYVAEAIKASELYTGRIYPELRNRQLSVGPATFFDPDIVAVHITKRSQLKAVGTYFDELTRQGQLRFWEIGDPELSHEEEGPVDSGEPWELVHQLPVEGKAVHAMMH